MIYYLKISESMTWRCWMLFALMARGHCWSTPVPVPRGHGPRMMAVSAPAAFEEPFAGVEVDLFEVHSEVFNMECYDCLFNWIPKYKEAGFSTFRFEDFIDERVRKLLPSMRTLVLRSAAEALFGSQWDALPALMGLESSKQLTRLYLEHAAASRGDDGGSALPFGLKLPSLSGMAGNSAALEEALTVYARSTVGNSAGQALTGLSASVEQIAALVCNLLVAAAADPAVEKRLAAEQVGRSPPWSFPSRAMPSPWHHLTGSPWSEQSLTPHSPHFTRWCPTRLPIERVSPLPLIGRLPMHPILQAAVLKGAAPDAPITAEVLAQMPQLDAFVQETLRTAAPTQPLGDGSASRGAQAAISMAKAVYVQLHRMFDVRKRAHLPRPCAIRPAMSLCALPSPTVSESGDPPHPQPSYPSSHPPGTMPPMAGGAERESALSRRRVTSAYRTRRQRGPHEAADVL